MSDQTNYLETASPDMVEAPEKGNGVRRLNRLPVLIIGVLLILVLMSFVYTGQLRSMMTKGQASAAEQDKYRISGVASPPVARPPGPDVVIASNAPVYNMPAAAIPGGPMPESDATRQARERKVAELDAALKADPGVEKFSSRQSAVNPVTAQQPPQMPLMMPPPRPGQPQGGDGLDSMMGGASPVRNHSGFGGQDDSSIYLPHAREAALSETEIKAGSIIPGVMISGINSDLPGSIIGQVRQNVYDSATGRHLLIPAGAKLIGTYDSNVVAGEERVLIAWNRIIFPDSSSITLNNMPGADQIGQAGFNDQVNNHYWRTFGNALLLSVLSAGMQIGQQPRGGSANGQLSATQIAAAASAMQFGMIGKQSARRGLNTPPTMEIRPGFLFNIMITKDMILPLWGGHPVAQKTAAREVSEETEGSGSYQQLY